MDLLYEDRLPSSCSFIDSNALKHSVKNENTWKTILCGNLYKACIPKIFGSASEMFWKSFGRINNCQETAKNALNSNS